MTTQKPTTMTKSLASNPLPGENETAPEPIRWVASQLADGGDTPWLVGPSLHGHLCGQPPRAWEMTVALPAAWILKRFPKAVATASNLRCLSLPTEAGPVDLVPRPPVISLEERLAANTFTIDAIAWEPHANQWFDPFGGMADVAGRRLITLQPPALALARDPLAALRAAVLAAERGYRVDPAFAANLSAATEPLGLQPRAAVRTLLLSLLRVAQPGRGIALLREGGIESALLPGALPDGAQLIDELPVDPSLRLAAWLRGTRSDSVLARLRFGPVRSRILSRILRHHPIDGVTPSHRLERAARRLSESELAALFALRRAEIALCDPAARTAAQKTLDHTVAQIQAARSPARSLELALDGRDIMTELDCGPGRRVGQAIHFLTTCVRSDPTRNTADELRERLRRWSRENPP